MQYTELLFVLFFFSILKDSFRSDVNKSVEFLATDQSDLPRKTCIHVYILHLPTACQTSGWRTVRSANFNLIYPCCNDTNKPNESTFLTDVLLVLAVL